MTTDQDEADLLLAKAFADFVDDGAPLWRYAGRRPRLVVEVARALRRLEVLDVDLPAGPQADEVRRVLRRYPVSRRAMLGVAAVLRTPEVPGGYAEGPARATLRRKMRAAEKRGITIRPVPAVQRPLLRQLADAHERENEREQYRNAAPDNDALLQHDLWLTAYDADDRPIMLTVIPTAGRWAVLQYFRTLEAGQAASDARYLMTNALAEELAARGVRYLVDSARPHWLPNGLRHFQRMVGFRLVRLRGIDRR